VWHARIYTTQNLKIKIKKKISVLLKVRDIILNRHYDFKFYVLFLFGFAFL